MSQNTSKPNGFNSLKAAQERMAAIKRGAVSAKDAAAASRPAPAQPQKIVVQQPTQQQPVIAAKAPQTASSEPAPQASAPRATTAQVTQPERMPDMVAPAAKAPAVNLMTTGSASDRFAALAMAHGQRGRVKDAEQRPAAEIATEAMARISADIEDLADWARKPAPDVQLKLGKFFQLVDQVLGHYKAPKEEFNDMRRKGITGTIEDLDWLIDWHAREWAHIRFMTDDAYAVQRVIEETPRFKAFFDQYGAPDEGTGVRRRAAAPG